MSTQSDSSLRFDGGHQLPRVVEGPSATAAQRAPVSVVIPAHNEGAVIDRCLRRLVEGAGPGELEIVVVCNGCRDDTAERVRRFGPPVRVLETPEASKSVALNLGDRAVVGFPRFFVDADVQIDWDAVTAVRDCLGSGEVLAAAPRVHFDVRMSSWPVRGFYRIWSQLPYTSDGMIGSGVYALSRAGRSRFQDFPAITADDLYVYRCFDASERRTVMEHRFTVVAPRDLPSLVAIKTRARFGNIELDHCFPESKDRRSVSHALPLARLVLNPWNWFGLVVYAYVRLRSRLLAQRRWDAGDHRRWERDESSRGTSPTADSSS